MPKSEEVMAAVDGWFNERIKRGPIAQHTPAYNQAYQALPDLKARIAKVLEEEPAAPAASEPVAPAAEAKAPAAPKAAKTAKPKAATPKAKTKPAAPAASEPKE